MAEGERRKRLRSAFGQALAAQLAARGSTQTNLATALGRSTSYLNQVMNGHKTASSSLVEQTANCLNLEAEARTALHRAAATDHGFKLDLTERKDPSPSG